MLVATFLFVAVFVFAAAWFAHLVLAELAAVRALQPPPNPIDESPTP
jgi:hypothetical protein